MKWIWPIACDINSSCAVVLGHHIYGDDDCPKIIDWLHTQFGNLLDIQNWFHYRFVKKYKYNVIYTGLPPGYYDEDERILWACMAMLEHYIKWHGGEKEFAKFTDELLAGTDAYTQGELQNEAYIIYRWWKYQKPMDEKRKEELLDAWYSRHMALRDKTVCLDIETRSTEIDELFKEYTAMELKIYQEEDEYLGRLVKIRRSLWT